MLAITKKNTVFNHRRAFIFDDVGMSIPVLKLNKEQEVVPPLPFNEWMDVLLQENDIIIPNIRKKTQIIKDDLSRKIAIVLCSFFFSSFSTPQEIAEYSENSVDSETVKAIINAMTSCGMYDRTAGILYMRPIINEENGRVFLYLEVAEIKYQMLGDDVLSEDGLELVVIDGDALEIEDSDDDYSALRVHSPFSGPVG